MLTEMEYRTLRDRIDRYQSAREELYPNKCSFTPIEIQSILDCAGLETSPSNEEMSKVEVYEFYHNTPTKYFLYVDEKTSCATTWVGDSLGTVTFGREWKDNFGGRRVPISLRAINGKEYHGTYYKSSGDYARVTMCKDNLHQS